MSAALRTLVLAAATIFASGHAGSALLSSQQLLSTGPPTRVTSEDDHALFPTVARDGALAYSKIDGGDWDIFLQAPGAEAVNLTADSTADDWQAEFSPDGTRLVLRSERDGGGLYLMDRNGGGLERLTNVGFNPSWSPDAAEIVYSSTQIIADPTTRPIPGELSIIRVDTRERRLLYAQADAVQPRWSPDGSRIAFWGFARQGGQRDVWTVSVAGGPAVPVTEDSATDWSPAWSANGAYLYFASDRRGTMDIWRVQINQSTGEVLSIPQEVTSGASGVRGHIALLPGVRALVFAEQRLRPAVERRRFDPVAGQLVGDPVRALGTPVRPFDVAPSPDGRRVAFYARNHAGEGPQEPLYVAPSGGDQFIQLTPDSPGARHRGPQWSPDGSRIAFYSDRTGNYEIWTVNPDGSGLRQITRDMAANRSGVVWAPNSTRLLYRQRSGLSRESYIIDTTRSPEEQLLEELPAIGGSDEYFEASSWSPNGRWIAGSRVYVDRTDTGGIFLYDVQARTFQSVTAEGRRPLWLDDSRHLIYIAGDDRLMLVDATSFSPPQELVSVAPQVLDGIGLTADNQTIFLSTSTAERDLWRTELR